MQRGRELARLALLGALEVGGVEPHVAAPQHDGVLALERARPEVDDVEGASPVGPDPPLRVQDHRATRAPRAPLAADVHADALGEPRLARDPLREALAHDARDQQAGRREHAVQLEQPRRPRARQVREHRQRPDQVERAVGERERRALAGDMTVDRRVERLLDPGDRRRVDVATVHLGAGRVADEVPQHAPGAAAEVEHALAGEVPPWGRARRGSRRAGPGPGRRRRRPGRRRRSRRSRSSRGRPAAAVRTPRERSAAAVRATAPRRASGRCGRSTRAPPPPPRARDRPRRRAGTAR